MPPEPHVAFVTDALPSIGGAEKVLFKALEIFPAADVFTLIYNREVFVGTPLGTRRIKTSILDRLPLAHANHRLLLPLMPAAVQSFDLSPYDLVVSFSYAVAHGARARASTRLVSYTYTPLRYAWDRLNLDGTHVPNNPIVGCLLAAFREWDKRAAARVDEFGSISHHTARRIQRAYGREARVIYPPVEVDRFRAEMRRGAYYVTISRLVPHKRVDLIVEAFTALKLPLLVIGEGPELTRLERRAGPNIKFTGYLPDPAVEDLLSRARAFVTACEEDFGIAIVEAQAAGCPVISYRGGGALETVIEGSTGEFFSEQTPSNIIEAIKRFDASSTSYRAQDHVKNAARFGAARFKKEFAEFVLAGMTG